MNADKETVKQIGEDHAAAADPTQVHVRRVGDPGRMALLHSVREGIIERSLIGGERDGSILRIGPSPGIDLDGDKSIAVRGNTGGFEGVGMNRKGNKVAVVIAGSAFDAGLTEAPCVAFKTRKGGAHVIGVVIPQPSPEPSGSSSSSAMLLQGLQEAHNAVLVIDEEMNPFIENGDGIGAFRALGDALKTVPGAVGELFNLEPETSFDAPLNIDLGLLQLELGEE